MSVRINQEYVNDIAKLMIHRLIARAIGRDPSLVERAKASLALNLQQRSDACSFVREWNELLHRPPSEIRRLLTSRDEDMTRLRLSSPLVVADGIAFGDDALRRRIWKAAKRVAQRPAVREPAFLPRIAL